MQYAVLASNYNILLLSDGLVVCVYYAAQISDEMLGKNAQTVVRDKATGRKRDLTAERAKQAEADASKAVTAAKYDAWNKG